MYHYKLSIYGAKGHKISQVIYTREDCIDMLVEFGLTQQAASYALAQAILYNSVAGRFDAYRSYVVQCAD